MLTPIQQPILFTGWVIHKSEAFPLTGDAPVLIKEGFCFIRSTSIGSSPENRQQRQHCSSLAPSRPGALLQQNGRGSARQAGSPSDAHRASVSHRARHVAVAHTTRHTHLPHGANLPHGAHLPHGASLPHGADLAHGTDLPHGGHLPHGAHLSHGTDLPHRAHGAELCRATPGEGVATSGNIQVTETNLHRQLTRSTEGT